MIIDRVVIGFSFNELRINFQLCDLSIINFGKKGFCLGFSNKSHVYSFNIFMKVIVENFHSQYRIG